MAAVSPQVQHASEHSTDAAVPEGPKRRPSWNVEVPSAETTAIATVGVVEASHMVGWIDGELAGGSLAVGMLLFLVKRCIKRIR